MPKFQLINLDFSIHIWINISISNDQCIPMDYSKTSFVVFISAMINLNHLSTGRQCWSPAKMIGIQNFSINSTNDVTNRDLFYTPTFTTMIRLSHWFNVYSLHEN